eukprot:TRINITY_DN3225_c0_g1_i1.p1 TRINITY_DN3225_c0_g1~~TRINITY_DN3225_c0_g1_i1.p1  ORF type:complete len:933 (+),score=167.49 TRINITY_DN3225_c0_g1_i1:114-2801(+)
MQDAASQHGGKSLVERFYRWMRRPGDTELDEQHRRILIPVGLVCLVFSLTTHAMLGFESEMSGLGRTMGMLVVASWFLVPVLRLPLSYSHLVGSTALVVMVAIIMVDITNAAYSRGRSWMLAVMVMDMLLVFRIPLPVHLTALAITLLGVAVDAVESVAQFGLYTVFLWGKDSWTVPVCDCVSPPCAMAPSSAISAGTAGLCALVADYLITRRFATRMVIQHDVLQTTASISERVALLLASYATEEARAVLESSGHQLPNRMRAAYRTLVHNLDAARAFLPDALLLEAKDKGLGTAGSSEEEEFVLQSPFYREPLPANTRPPPGLGTPQSNVAVCFSDVQSSTELWETFPQGMYEALDLHNSVMRVTCADHNGYEVKTIGDSFMVVFDGPLEAVGFGLDAQLQLLRQHWPNDLLTHPLCAPCTGAAGELLWSGLRVRIGVNHGPCRQAINPVTKRFDYFGTAVNIASRLEALLRKGGLVATTSAVVNSLGDGGLHLLGSPVVHSHGLSRLKGVAEKVDVKVLTAQSLAARINVLTSLSTAILLQAQSGRSTQIVSVSGSPVPPSFGSSSPRLSPVLSSEQSAPVSVSNPILPSAPTMPVPRRMHKSTASCAVARIALQHAAPVEERWLQFIAGCSTAADRTQGIVEAVLSASVIATWNATRNCASHTSACMNFITVPFRTRCHRGASTGGVFSGSFSAGRRSYATGVGGCIDLAAALAEEAERCGDAALITGCVAEQCMPAGVAFWAQLWMPVGQPAFKVWEVDLQKVGGKWLLTDEDFSQTFEPNGSPLQGTITPALFSTLCSAAEGTEEHDAALGELRQIAEAGSERAVRLLRRKENGTVCVRHCPYLWDALEAGGLPEDFRVRSSLFASMDAQTSGATQSTGATGPLPVTSS